MDFMQKVKSNVAQQQATQQVRNPTISIFSTPYESPTFLSEVKKLMKGYGFASTKAERAAGMLVPDDEIMERIVEHASYNAQKQDFGATYGLSHDPWQYADNPQINEAMAGFYKLNARAPKNEQEFNAYYLPNYEYKGQYGSTLEDQLAQKEGRAPFKYQVTQSIRQKLAALGENATVEAVQKLIDSDPYMKDLAADSVKRQQEITDGTKSTSSYKGTPLSEYKDIDVEGLKALGYDPNKGWQPLIDEVALYQPAGTGGLQPGQATPQRAAAMRDYITEQNIAGGTSSPESRARNAYLQGEEQSKRQTKAEKVAPYYSQLAEYMSRDDSTGAQAYIDHHREEFQIGGADVQQLKDTIANQLSGERQRATDPNAALQWQESAAPNGTAGYVSDRIVSRTGSADNGRYIIAPDGNGGYSLVYYTDDDYRLAPLAQKFQRGEAITPEERKEAQAYVDKYRAGGSKRVEHYYSLEMARYVADQYKKQISTGKWQSLEKNGKMYQDYINSLPPEQADIETKRLLAYGVAKENRASTTEPLEGLLLLVGFVDAVKSNLLSTATEAIAGKPITPWKINAGWEDFSQKFGAATGTKPASEELGPLGNAAMDMAGSLTNLVGAGAGKGILASRRALGLTPKALRSADYALGAERALAANKLRPGAMAPAAALDEAELGKLPAREDFTISKPGTLAAPKPLPGGKLAAKARASDTMGASLRAPGAPTIAPSAQGRIMPAEAPRAAVAQAAKPAKIKWNIAKDGETATSPDGRFTVRSVKTGGPYVLTDSTYLDTAGTHQIPYDTKRPYFSSPNDAKVRAQSILGGEAEAARGNIAAAAPEAKAAAFAETESNPLFNGQLMGGANPNAKPAQAFETSASRLSYRDRAKIKMQQILDPSASLKHLPGTKWAAGETNAVYRGAINSKNVQNQIANIYEVALVDKNGNVIGDSLSKLLRENIPQGQEADFWTAALQKHNIARAGQGKPIFSQIVGGKEVYFSAAESKAAYEAAIKLHPEWATKINNITGWIKKFEKAWGVDTGLFTADKFKELGELHPDYLPTDRAFNDLEDFLPGGGGTGKGFVDQTNTIRSATGSSRNIIDPTENIITLVNRTVRSARMNEVGQLFADVIRKNPEAMKPIAEIVSAPKANVDNIMRVLSEGNPVYVKVNDAAVLDALTRLSSIEKLSDVSNAFNKVTGFMKQVITTKNPVFGLLNGFRDIQTYLVMSKANPIKALGRYARAGAEIVASDIINPALRKLTGKEIPTPKLSQFRVLGGEGSTLTGVAPSIKKAQQLTGRVAITNKVGEITGYRNVNPVARLGKWIGKEAQKFNTAIEATPKYAEYLNALKKGKSLEEALYDAAEITTNFSRGGRVLKEADAYMIYLNASVQGLSRLGRALNPFNPRQLIGTLLKGGIAVTLPTAILFETNKNNPNYQALSNNIKDTYYLIPNISDLDENGNPKTFIRIPKSRELGVLFGAFYERIYRAAQGEQGAFKGLGQSFATNLSPNIGLAPSAVNPLIDLASNKNFFGGAIVPEYMKSRSPHLQYDEKTSEPSKWFANALYDVAGIEVSPKQIDYLSDAYLGIISDVGLPVSTKATWEKQGPIGAAISPVLRRFTADPLYSNQTITDFYDEMDRLNTIAADKNFSEDIPGEVTTPEERQYSVMTKASKAMSELSRQSQNATDPEDVRKYMIYIARNALDASKRGMMYVPPLKIAEKDSEGKNKRDAEGATIYRYLSMDEYRQYQQFLDAAYQKIINDPYYKQISTDAKKAKSLATRMNDAVGSINSKFLRK